MFFYILGYIFGLVTLLLTIYAFFWLILKLFKKVKDIIYSNPTKEILKEYLFIWDFVEDITTIDELKEKLKTILSKKLYKNNSNKIYFTKEESLAFKDSVDEISVSDILNSQTLLQSLVENLKHITLYDKNDLKNISKFSYMVWIHKYGFNSHLILNNDKFVYPLDYPKDNKYKFQLHYDKKVVDKLGEYNFTLYVPDGEKSVIKPTKETHNIIIDILNLTYSIVETEHPEIRTIDASRLKHLLENL
jgi:hypothetical protein